MLVGNAHPLAHPLIMANSHSNSESDDESQMSGDLDHQDDERKEDVTDKTQSNAEPIPNTYDLALPTTHSYLGQNLEELRGRTILDDGIYMNLLLIKQSMVLFPGQTLPMTVYDMETINVLQTCIQNNRTFGVVCRGYGKPVCIGTTAEIYEYTNDDREQGFRVKAKGRQRFKILRVIIQDSEKISADVKILPEITLEHPFLDERFASLNHRRMHATNEKEMKKQEKVENLDAIVTPWPAWVYRQYDPMRLSLQIRKHLEFIEMGGSSIPKDPTELSFWVAQNLVLDDEERIILLNYDCAISRLQREITYFGKDQIFVCSNCDLFIAKQSYIIPMNKEGPQNAYCNAGGVIYETITFNHAHGLRLRRDPPSTEYSWFPGYAWAVAHCENCRAHMGWMFMSAKPFNLKPPMFWGLTRKSLKIKLANENERRDMQMEM